ncbi:MAG: Oligopeptide-binding protein AppA [Chloroflexi bacterium]|nr:Oligopeptide-binding protein AppA [Chloroflexota bacterium]
MKKVLLILSLLVVGMLAFTACATPEPEVIEKTVIVEKEGETIIKTVEVEVEAEEEAPAGGECCDNYTLGIFEEPVSLNYWNYLGPGSSVWTQYVLAGNQPSLFGLAAKTFQFVPSLATDIPTPVENDDGTYTITVNMLEGPTWSDGELVTAQDYVFTFNACKDLKLTQNWPNQCQPAGLDAEVEALDDYTLEFTFLNQAPSLGNWQAGLALAPILPEHFWGDAVDEAYVFVADATEPEMERPDDCVVEDEEPADPEACDAWAAYDEAFSNARKTLYEADPAGSPSGGSLTTDKWEAGAFVQRTARDDSFFAGTEVVEYDDGTYLEILPDGTERQFYGEATGEETLRYTSGPYSPTVIHSIYGSQDAAFLALANEEVDYVINPLGLSRGLKEKATQSQNVVSYTNADYGMYYLAFNFNKAPMNDQAFREAFEIVIDKSFVVNQVLAGVVYPMYSTMPPGNGFYHNPDVPKPYVGMSREERVNEAVAVLKDAGWAWETEPAWNADTNDVDPGVGITMPNGEPMPEVVILGPGPAYDPIRATFNQWISEWARELGMPVESELTGFNTILGPVFVNADYDMYILGWSLGNVAFPDYYEAFWHSSNCTAETGNYNTPCYKNDDYDALVDEFMSTSDIDRARELVFEMQVKLTEDLPYITLFYKQTEDLALGRVEYPYTETLGGIEFQAGFQSDAQVLTMK